MVRGNLDNLTMMQTRVKIWAIFLVHWWLTTFTLEKIFYYLVKQNLLLLNQQTAIKPL